MLNRDVHNRTIKTAALITCCSILISCATPSEKFASTADRFGFSAFSIKTDRFIHQAFANFIDDSVFKYQPLHVYLDGDGTPWKNKYTIANDPTARNPLILKLMRRDPGPAILLGRPCYYGLSQTVSCHPKYWTAQRYSTTVVKSMAEALNLWLLKHNVKQLTLIGYSGGGALAVLIAPYLPQKTSVITIAANLDVAAWSRHHGYDPLTESLNPLDIKIPETIRQIHLQGGKDAVVPPSTVQKFLLKNPSARVLSFAQYTHQCGWVDHWPEILRQAIAVNSTYH